MSAHNVWISIDRVRDWSFPYYVMVGKGPGKGYELASRHRTLMAATKAAAKITRKYEREGK